jgi:oxygen-independent coproporphyrinogen-3 oxidase
MTEAVAATDFTGYTVQYPPLALWGAVDGPAVLRSWRAARDERPGLYVHAPYCSARCSYCRYFSQPLPDAAALDAYIDGLAREAALLAPHVRHLRFATLYVGGGTPTILDERRLERFFGTLARSLDIDRTVQRCVESTPATLTPGKLRVLRRHGVTRLTVGVQTLTARALAAVGRRQTARRVRDAIRGARAAGIRHVNVDLLAGLPGETVKSFVASVARVIALDPDMVHIHGFYPTPYTRYWREGGRPAPEEMDARHAMMSEGQRLLAAAGYRPAPYDASARTPEARNVQLADAIERVASFLGLGPGAASHVREGWRTVNHDDVGAYLAALRAGRPPWARGVRLRRRDEMVYFVTAALRYGEASRRRFRELFGRDLVEVFRAPIRRLERRGLLRVEPDRIVLCAPDLGTYLVCSKYFWGEAVVAALRRVMGPLGRWRRPGYAVDTRHMLL